MKGESKEINYPIRSTNVQTDGTPSIDLDNRKQLYRSVSEVITNIPITNRNVGLTVVINNENGLAEYWWEKGIKDSDLILKFNSKDIPNLQATVVDLQHQIDNVNNIEFKVFNSLPTVGDSSIIYVIPNSAATEDDDYIEYFWINSEQRYERFGGLDASGGVTINNFYTFDENVFTVDEESDYKNVYLNSKKISIIDKGIKIYKLDIGEEDNEELLYIQNFSRTVGSSVSRGGGITLNGKYIAQGQTNREYQTILFYDRLEVSYEQGSDSFRAVLGPNTLHIEDSNGEVTISTSGIQYAADDRNTFELNNNNLISRNNKIILEALSNDGFDINYNEDVGIKGYVDNNINTLMLYNLDNTITVTDNDIKLEIAGDSYIHLNYNTFNAVFNQSIYLNAPETKVDLLKFSQSIGADTYLQGYHLSTYGNIYHGIKASTSIYLSNSNPYYIQSSGYSLVSYGLNAIKYRNSATPTTLGSNIISWNETNNYPILRLGIDSTIVIEETKISAESGDAKLVINNNGEIKFDTTMDTYMGIESDGEIRLIQPENYIKIKNTPEINIYSGATGHNGTIKIDTFGKNNIYLGELSSSNKEGVEVQGKYDILLHNYERPCYIRMYYNNSDDEDNIIVKGQYFYYKNTSDREIIRIDADDDITFKPGNAFYVTFGSSNYHRLVVDYSDGIVLGKSNSEFTIGNQVMKFKVGTTTITIDQNGISDGTNTKTWAQLLS